VKRPRLRDSQRSAKVIRISLDTRARRSFNGCDTQLVVSQPSQFPLVIFGITTPELDTVVE